MNRDILLHFMETLMLSTNLPVQAWIFVVLALIGVAAIVSILVGKAVSVWKDALRK